MKGRVYWILGGILALLVLIEAFFAPHHHPVFPWHHWPGYQGVLGLATCVGLVLLLKWMGSAFLQRPDEEDES